ncbi:MAG TPA: CTP synthase [Clostridiales bacterium]|nr:CTP synthase [Clostridiales bacterium]
MSAKYIFITGGVVSGLGKGITAASLGRLMKARGYKVTLQKLDPYINVDAGQMSPLQHGESFVTDDGAETDLDVGHYERFVDENLSVNSSVTAGKIYWTVLNKERRGEYGGATVQVIPHITGEIKERIYNIGRNSDIVIAEIGGTVGDIESQPFLEAIRQIQAEIGHENAVFVHVTLVPYISGSNELKSKPTQHSVKELLSLGIQPNILVCRSDFQLNHEMRSKIALFCNVRPQDVIHNETASSLYEVPLLLEKEGLARSVCHHLRLPDNEPDLKAWSAMVERQKNPESRVKIGLVGQYVALHDAYLSVAEAICHAGIHNQTECEIKWISTNDVKTQPAEQLFSGCDGIIAVGGFGEEDCEGYIAAAKYCRENNIPYFGLCQGMAGAVLDAARNIADIKDAGSAEYGDCEPVIQKLVDLNTGISPFVRKGLYPCLITPGSRLADIYDNDLVYERHHCSYEFNSQYREAIEKTGLKISAQSPDSHLVEAVEYPDHPFFIAVQYFCQYSSRPNRAHPLFIEFVKTLKDRA